MKPTTILSIILIILSTAFITFLVRITIKRAKALSERIDEYHEAQEEQANKPGPIDPYADIASITAPEPENKDKK